MNSATTSGISLASQRNRDTSTSSSCSSGGGGQQRRRRQRISEQNRQDAFVKEEEEEMTDNNSLAKETMDKTKTQNHDCEDEDDDDDMSEDIDLSSDEGDADLEKNNTAMMNEKGEELLQLRVKAFKDVTITVPATSTIQQVKAKIVEALGPQAENRYIRLICRGRLLAPDNKAIGECYPLINTGDVLHAVLAAAGQRGGPQAVLQAGGNLYQNNSANASNGIARRSFRGTGINAAGIAVRNTDPDSDEEDSDLDDLENARQRPERLGFDRLRTALRRSEVTAIRAYFSRHVDRWIRQHPEAAEAAAAGETDLLRRRLLQEDAWMQSQGPMSEFRINLGGSTAGMLVSAASQAANMNPNDPQQQQQSMIPIHPWGTSQQQQLSAAAAARLSASEAALWRSSGYSAAVGTDRDFLWGFLLGFFVGFLMLVWVWMPTVPHKQKLGILTGISLQLALGLLKKSSEETDDVIGDY